MHLFSLLGSLNEGYQTHFRLWSIWPNLIWSRLDQQKRAIIHKLKKVTISEFLFQISNSSQAQSIYKSYSEHPDTNKCSKCVITHTEVTDHK